jgi:hypothetical protein
MSVYFAGAVSMLLLQGCMWMYVSIYGTNETGKNNASAKDAEADTDAADRASSSKGKKKKASILEGIHLFIKHNYVKLITN